MKETSKAVARLAARFLAGELKTLTRKQKLSMAGSLVAQAEREQESARAWCVLDFMGKLYLPSVRKSKRLAAGYLDEPDDQVIPVLITRVRPARADKRLKRKRKRG